jgi:hypothetical protein
MRLKIGRNRQKGLSLSLRSMISMARWMMP